MKRYLLLIILLIAGDKAWGQIRLSGDAFYRFAILGHRKEKQDDPLGFRYRYELTELNLTYNDGSKKDLLYGATLISDLGCENETPPRRLPPGSWGSIDGHPLEPPADPPCIVRAKSCLNFDIRKKISRIDLSYYDAYYSPYSGKTYKHQWNSSDNIKPSNEEEFIGKISNRCFSIFDLYVKSSHERYKNPGISCV